MIVSTDDLKKTELYPEIVSQIIRNDSETAELQIQAAEDIVATYLFKYDLNAILGTSEEPPTFDSPMVKKMVKIIATWFLLKMANPNVDIGLWKEEYDQVIKMLEEIRDGKMVPRLPYAPDNEETPEDESGSDVYFSSNIKRIQHF